MDLMRLLLVLSLCLLALASEQKADGEACEVDSECLSQCCSNNKDYSSPGICVDIVDNERCHHR